MTFTITWYGHAGLEMQTGGYNLLFDPFLTGNPAAATTADGVHPDFILVSHGHGDHVGDVVSIARRTGAPVISNAEIASWLENQGLKTHAQHIGGGYNHPFGYLKLVQALHGSALPDGSYGGSPAGFLLTTLQGDKYYFAGDTGLFSDMRLLGEAGLNLAVLPIGDNFTMGPADALQAVRLLQPKHVLPVHYNTWDLIAQDAEAWADQVRRENRSQVHVLKPGESLVIN